MPFTSRGTKDIRDFGIALIRSQDLDPVYTGLYRATLPKAQLERALLAYWCFYSLGFAAYASEFEGGDFWDRLLVAAANEEPSPVGGRWPRATERRHFRGAKCTGSIGWLSKQAPEYWVQSLMDATTEKQVMDRVNTWPMFGPWIAFKAADMMERVYGQLLTFDQNLGLMYDSPRKALDLLAADESFIAVDKSAEGLYQNLLRFFSSHRAPPGGDRYCNAQEVETILCKWGSMQSGHYHVGKDITEVRHALTGWGETATRILKVMPEEITDVVH
jgi:Alpha-glutamyl/putrescinyl thymine pyrophosphorylase clade 2